MALGHSQPAKVNPTLHGIATLVEELSCLRIQSKQNCRACPRAPFLGGQKVPFPVFNALVMKEPLDMLLLRILSGREREQDAVGNDGRVR
ncbi:MAG: hypothetical protein DMG24_10315 [Acidobacteria bacterium]|nr:MAG: hypothetical protein DMG24_10315 [Acidobacteriota bacterium]